MTVPRPPGRFRPELLFQPRGVAVLGAESEAGAQVLANLRAGGFKGSVSAFEGGEAALRDWLAALPGAPDLAVIGMPPEEVAGALAALGDRGTRAAVVVGMAPGLAEAARAAGVAVLGPGSFGVAVPSIGLNASRAHLAPRPGRLALVSQSAALCRAVLDWAEPNGVGFSHVIGIGGNAGIGFGVALDWLARDPGTGAILLDIRRIKDRRMFLAAARAASRLRPVVALRAGGRLLDPSGAAEAAFAAALRRSGVLSVARLEDLLAAAETLTRAKPLRGEALAIVTNAIGPGQLAADAALACGLDLAVIPPEARAVLSFTGMVGAATERILYAGLDAPTRVAEAAAMLGGIPEVGGVLTVTAPTGAADAAGVEALVACAATLRKPLLACVMGETTGSAHRRRLAEAGIPVFPAPEQAVRGFLHLVQDRRNRAAARELPPSTVLSLTPDRAAVRRIFAAVRRSGRTGVRPEEALDVLAAYGVPTAPTRAVASPADAAAAAELLGFPAVLKLRRSGPPPVDGGPSLALDLHDEAELLAAARTLAARHARRAPGTPFPGFIVQRQVGRASELRVRVAEDQLMGPVISFGEGGTTSDLLRDGACDLPPLNLWLARALIGRTRAARLLAERRDVPAANVEAVAGTLVRVSQLIVDFPEIAELDVNPLFADADGVLAADAWLLLRAPGARPDPLAISPYPAELAETWEIGGEVFVVRPIRPEDAEAHAVFFSHLSREDVRFRFFSMLRELTPEQIARMTQVDYEREMAFVAVREATGETVGVCRLIREAASSEAEFAIVVRPDLKGKGLARRLMDKLIAWGASRGVTQVFGHILAENTAMLHFVRKLGFRMERLPEEPDVLRAVLDLPRPAAPDQTLRSPA